MTSEQASRKSLEEAKAYLAEALPIQDAMIIGVVSPDVKQTEEGGGLLPETLSLIWIDATARPDIGDLARVHALDGSGEGDFVWVYIDEHLPDSYFVLNVHLYKPVRVTFRIAFRMLEWYTLLKSMASTGTLSLVVGPSVRWRELAQRMEPAQLLEIIGRSGGGILGLLMNKVTRSELQHHYTVWITRYGPYLS